MRSSMLTKRDSSDSEIDDLFDNQSSQALLVFRVV